jgi:hypothetical protein
MIFINQSVGFLQNDIIESFIDDNNKILFCGKNIKTLPKNCKIVYSFSYNKKNIFTRFSTFCFKILNKVILSNFFKELKPYNNVKNTRCHNRNIFTVLRSLTTKAGKRLSIYLPQMVNKVLKYSYNLTFDFLNNLFFSIFLIFIQNST